MDRIRVGLVGCGAWGRNIAREIVASPRARLSVVVDPNPGAREIARALDPEVTLVSSIEGAMAMREHLDAIVVASPPELHADHAREALDAGLHVLVEKPLAIHVADACDLMHRAEQMPTRVALVGHIMRYHPAVEKLERMVSSGALGRPVFAVAARLSPSRSSDGSVVWALGPHDLSIGLALARASASSAEPSSIAHAGVAISHVAIDDATFPGRSRDARADKATLYAVFEGGLSLRAHLSRAHARKERIFLVAGTCATAWFDDVRAPGVLRFTNGRLVGPASSAQVLIRAAITGAGAPVDTLDCSTEAPLTRELDHFWACIRGEALPKTPFSEGLEVVRGLSEATRPTLTGRAGATISTP